MSVNVSQINHRASVGDAGLRSTATISSTHSTSRRSYPVRRLTSTSCSPATTAPSAPFSTNWRRSPTSPWNDRNVTKLRTRRLERAYRRHPGPTTLARWREQFKRQRVKFVSQDQQLCRRQQETAVTPEVSAVAARVNCCTPLG